VGKWQGKVLEMFNCTYLVTLLHIVIEMYPHGRLSAALLRGHWRNTNIFLTVFLAPKLIMGLEDVFFIIVSFLFREAILPGLYPGTIFRGFSIIF
jgi:hypothetical protein